MKFSNRLFVLIFILSFSSLAGGLLTNTPSQYVTLAWSYPTNFFSQAYAQMQQTLTNPATWPALTNLSYYIYGATTLNGTNTQWNFYLGTNNPTIITNANGELFHAVSVPLVFPPQQQFFTIQSSNATGKSFFSGLAATPPPSPSQRSFTIQSTQ